MARKQADCLTPEEDAVDDPDEEDEESDPLLPADLWFRRQGSARGTSTSLDRPRQRVATAVGAAGAPSYTAAAR